ncbi:hypothetical protein [Exiguobacterium sp. UBA5002]|uniref:hypothetical protein n=1 Tax=Exiguobacterium sp. UBA5002 TaxID=1946497 RepID=UPI0025BEAA4E|nr:hypothetical protein [Exiguobacterium sp. UBA5002]
MKRIKEDLDETIMDTLNNTFTKWNLENIHKEQLLKIGEGAWHSVYRVTRSEDQDLVIRLKKNEAYGELQQIDEQELTTEYESTKAYYLHANKSNQTVCPNFYQYFIEKDLVFTVETFMGSGTDLLLLDQDKAHSYGTKLGRIYHNIHNYKTSIAGFGELHWNGKTLQGSDLRNEDELWLEENEHVLTTLNMLIHSSLCFDKEKVGKHIHALLENRRTQVQNISLVNQDVTPENLILTDEHIAIIDPFPRLDFDLKYAAYFVFCYIFLLPAFSNAPRYINQAYKEKSYVLNKIADGFISGYCSNVVGDERTTQTRRLLDEYTLWILQEAYEHFDILHQFHLTHKTTQQMGNREMITARLHLCLEELEKWCTE